MKMIHLMINHQLQTVPLERYFKALDNEYFIYRDGGADVDGNVRIHVAKLDGNYHVIPMEDIEEWEAIKKIIVEIVNDNREDVPLSIEDLDYHLLENIEITETKALRLPSAIMPYLSANQKEFPTLPEKAEKLEEKVTTLKDINDDLTKMMDEVGKEISHLEEQESEEHLGATMEIIMPTKQIVSEAKAEKETEKKEKNGFHFKNIFGHKKEEIEPEENMEEIKTPKEERPLMSDPIVKTVPEEPELPDTITLKPLVLTEVSEDEPLEVKPTAIEFHDSVKAPTIEVLELDEEQPEMESILNMPQDENEDRIKALEAEIEELKKQVAGYETVLKQIKDIVSK